MKKKIFCRCTLLCLVIAIANNRSAIAQQVANTGANTVESADGVQNGEPVVWAVPAEFKVRPETRMQGENLVWSKASNKITVAGAGNEHVPFQVVITVPVPPGRRPVPPGGFFIQSTDLKSKEGKIIPAERVRFFLEHYIMLTGISSPMGSTGYWPDAIVPIKGPFNMAAQYNVVKNRPIWVDVSVPTGAPAGNYSGVITVLKDNKPIVKINLEVEVYGFSLPEKTHLISYINVSKSWLAGFYHEPAASEKMDHLTQKYYEFLYDHRMEPWFNDQLQPEVAVNGEKVDVKFNNARYDYFMNKLETNRVLLNAFPPALKRQIKDAAFSDAFNKKIKSYLSQVNTYFEKNGWKKHLVFNSPIDEPNTQNDYEETRQWAKLVHDAAPGVPFLATESPVTDNPAWGVLTGEVNNFSIHGNALNNPEVKAAIITEQAKGGEMTWYISCDQKYPQPNYFIDAPALDLVMVPWITARYGMNGILYWGVNFWTQTINPWLNANTFISGFECSNGYILNGEGSVLYPGDFAKEYTGQPDVDGPVSSIRFELLREGIEDYDYLWMLGNLGDKTFAVEQTKDLVIDVSAFSRNLKDLYAARKNMAKRIEQLTK